jgi:hypothetical protein
MAATNPVALEAATAVGVPAGKVRAARWIHTLSQSPSTVLPPSAVFWSSWLGTKLPKVERGLLEVKEMVAAACFSG